MKTKKAVHTPGPWVVHRGKGRTYDVRSANRYEIVCSFIADKDDPIEAGNAQIIAASLDLLKASRIVLEAFRQNRTSEFIEVLEAAVAKAEGS